jgi:hypothetical protein
MESKRTSISEPDATVAGELPAVESQHVGRSRRDNATVQEVVGGAHGFEELITVLVVSTKIRV